MTTFLDTESTPNAPDVDDELPPIDHRRRTALAIAVAAVLGVATLGAAMTGRSDSSLTLTGERRGSHLGHRSQRMPAAPVAAAPVSLPLPHRLSLQQRCPTSKAISARTKSNRPCRSNPSGPTADAPSAPCRFGSARAAPVSPASSRHSSTSATTKVPPMATSTTRPSLP